MVKCDKAVTVQDKTSPYRDAEAGGLYVKGHTLWHLWAPVQWASLDAVLAYGCMFLAFQLSPSAEGMPVSGQHVSVAWAAALAAFFAFCLSYALGFSYYPNLKSRLRITAMTFLFALLAAGAVLVSVYFVFYQQLGRYIVGLFAVMFWVSCLFFKLSWFHRISRGVHRVMFVGNEAILPSVAQMVSDAAFPIRVVATHNIYPSSVDGSVAGNLGDFFSESSVHEVLVYQSCPADHSILLAAMDHGIAVSTLASFSERHFFKIPSVFLSATWFFQIDLKRYHPFYASSKRALDIGLAISCALAVSPFLLLSIVLIKLTSKGPAFYSQIRVGAGQVPFRIWKLRSMCVDSERNGAQWAKIKDNRVTWIGSVLRKTRMDEVPQFWNILRGDMSFIGPRPERPEFVERLGHVIPFYAQRHLVKPGLTGWAQICYRYGASEDDAREKLSYDLYYVKNASWLLDIQIVLQTLGAIAKGAR